MKEKKRIEKKSMFITSSISQISTCRFALSTLMADIVISVYVLRFSILISFIIDANSSDHRRRFPSLLLRHIDVFTDLYVGELFVVVGEM